MESNLRGGIKDPYNYPGFLLFQNQFIAGFSAYASAEYERAIDNWGNMDTKAEDFAKQLDNKKLVTATRDYYFYKGVTHLALAVTRTVKLSIKERMVHRNDAIEYLKKADTLNTAFKFKDRDRETYFLGLALGLAGSTQTSIKYLNSIEPNSRHYEKSKEYIKLWSEQ